MKKIKAGHYLYRGFKINCLGYVGGSGICWEAVDENGGGFAHSNTLRTTKHLIDWELDKNTVHDGKEVDLCPVCGSCLGMYGECDYCDTRENEGML